MKTHNVTVTVSARAGCGKTTIAGLIAGQLARLGIDIEFEDMDLPLSEAVAHTKDVLDRGVWSENVRVKIRTKQLARKPRGGDDGQEA